MVWDPNDGGDRESQEDKMIRKIEQSQRQREYNRQKNKYIVKNTSQNHPILNKKVIAFDFIGYDGDQSNGKTLDNSKYYRRGVVKEVYSCNGMKFVKIEFDHRKGFISEGHLLGDLKETI